MTRQTLCFSHGACLLTLSLNACGGKTADTWTAPTDYAVGGAGAGTTTGGIATNTIGGSVNAGGTSATAAGGSFDVATGGAFLGAGGSVPADELVPIAIPGLVVAATCGPNSLLKINGADATGCSVFVPLLPHGCGGTALADPSLVNVYFEQGDGRVFVVPRSNSGCAGHGWDLDATGTILSLCPKTCEALSQDASAVVEIAFACLTVQCIL